MGPRSSTRQGCVVPRGPPRADAAVDWADTLQIQPWICGARVRVNIVARRGRVVMVAAQEGLDVIDALARRGRIVMVASHGRLHESVRTGGRLYSRAIAPPPQLLAAAESLIGALEWHGVATIKFRVSYDEGRYWLTGANTRFPRSRGGVDGYRCRPPQRGGRAPLEDPVRIRRTDKCPGRVHVDAVRDPKCAL